MVQFNNHLTVIRQTKIIWCEISFLYGPKSYAGSLNWLICTWSNFKYKHFDYTIKHFKVISRTHFSAGHTLVVLHIVIRYVKQMVALCNCNAGCSKVKLKLDQLRCLHYTLGGWSCLSNQYLLNYDLPTRCLLFVDVMKLWGHIWGSWLCLIKMN